MCEPKIVTEIDVNILALGSKGDGVALINGCKVFVPFSVPGELVRVRIGEFENGSCRGEIQSVLIKNSDRKTPACDHFTICGGCAVQQLKDAKYNSWKRKIIIENLRRQKIESGCVKPLISGHSSKRRRVRFSARRLTSGTMVGFKKFGSNQIVDLRSCPVVVDKIWILVPKIRVLLNRFLKVRDRAEIAVILGDTELDITILTSEEPNLSFREAISDFAIEHDIARICWRKIKDKSSNKAEPLIQRRPVKVKYDKYLVQIPPDAFVQPTALGEEILRKHVMHAVSGATKIIELFSGCGAFTLPLAGHGLQVSAFDIEEEHIGSLLQAARAYGLENKITANTRDLYRRPLIGDDFSNVDAVILNPPRSGAGTQINHLAASNAPVVVYVSCNPSSFAQDAAKLIEFGYILEELVPVDQFLWSPHVELVAVLKRINT